VPVTGESVLFGMVAVFAIAFVWSWVATKEIAAISAGHPEKAAVWAAANSGLNFLITFTIALTLMFLFIFPYVLGCVLATYAATRKARA
jgi:hypothetical protein